MIPSRNLRSNALALLGALLLLPDPALAWGRWGRGNGPVRAVFRRGPIRAIVGGIGREVFVNGPARRARRRINGRGIFGELPFDRARVHRAGGATGGYGSGHSRHRGNPGSTFRTASGSPGQGAGARPSYSVYAGSDLAQVRGRGDASNWGQVRVHNADGSSTTYWTYEKDGKRQWYDPTLPGKDGKRGGWRTDDPDQRLNGAFAGLPTPPPGETERETDADPAATEPDPAPTPGKDDQASLTPNTDGLATTEDGRGAGDEPASEDVDPALPRSEFDALADGRDHLLDSPFGQAPVDEFSDLLAEDPDQPLGDFQTTALDVPSADDFVHLGENWGIEAGPDTLEGGNGWDLGGDDLFADASFDPGHGGFEDPSSFDDFQAFEPPPPELATLDAGDGFAGDV